MDSTIPKEDSVSYNKSKEPVPFAQENPKSVEELDIKPDEPVKEPVSSENPLPSPTDLPSSKSQDVAEQFQKPADLPTTKIIVATDGTGATVKSSSAAFVVPPASLKFQLNSIQQQKKPVISGSISNDEDSIEPANVSEGSKDQHEALLVDLPYKEPVWSGFCPPDIAYSLEVVKSGCSLEKLSIGDGQKKFHVFGRHVACDFHLEHPSVSRYHAVLQYRAIGDPRKDEVGWYLYDTGSTHGTFVNREKIPPNMFIRLKVGYVFKFGGSTRMFILQGPQEDEQAESNLTVTEIKQRALKQKLLFNLASKSNKIDHMLSSVNNEESNDKKTSDDSVEKKEPESSGIDWGMGGDYDVEDSDDDNDGTVGNNNERIDFDEPDKREESYKNDPKKALKNFFDREGVELVYDYVEKGGRSFNRSWTCRVELPVDTGTGKAIYAEATVSGGKKEAAIACALEACRMLDAYGVLRKSHQESKKRRSKDWKEDDYYDSDEDTFLDRTGDVERKRQQRLVRTAAAEAATTGVDNNEGQRVENYDSLKNKLTTVEQEIMFLQQQLDMLKAEMQLNKNSTEEVKSSSTTAARDTLDEYMVQMSHGGDAAKHSSKLENSKLKLRLAELQKEQARLKKLVEISKPTLLPTLKGKTLFHREDGRSMNVMTGSIKRRKMEDTKIDSDTSKQDVTRHKAEDEVKTIFIGQEEIEIDEQEDQSEKSVVVAAVDQPMSAPMSKADTCEKILTNQKADRSALQETKNEKQNVPSIRKLAKDRKDAPHVSQKKPKESDAKLEDYESMNDPDYAVWMPPEDQAGDGKTALNEKFGY